MAPELFRELDWDVWLADSFSIGVLLFTMVAGFQPYIKKAVPGDKYYAHFIQKNENTYWNLMN